jgi:hypothetical protein
MDGLAERIEKIGQANRFGTLSAVHASPEQGAGGEG